MPLAVRILHGAAAGQGCSAWECVAVGNGRTLSAGVLRYAAMVCSKVVQPVSVTRDTTFFLRDTTFFIHFVKAARQMPVASFAKQLTTH